VQLQHQVLGKVPEGSSGADTMVRFLRVLVQRFRTVLVEIPGEGSGAGLLLRFRKVPVQIAGEVLEGSGAGTW